MRHGTVLVIGDVMHDIVVRPAGPLRGGTDQRASINMLPGGAGANQASWLSHCGLAVRLLAGVAETDREIEAAHLIAAGVEPALAGDPHHPTGRLIALIAPDGERSFLTDRGANDHIALAACPTGLFHNVCHLHVSGYALLGTTTRATVRHLLDRARASGLPVSIDPGSAGFLADVGASTVLTWLGAVDLCVANVDEAALLTGSSDLEAQLAAMTEWATLAIVKRGPQGAMARHRDGRVWRQRAPVTPVVDTIGAGDAFLAGFLAAGAAGHDIAASLAAAVARGSEAVGLAGGRPPATKAPPRALP